MIDPSRRQQYLKSVCESGDAWWEPYARFIKEINDETWSPFELMVKRDEPQGQEKADQQRNKPLPVLIALNEYGNTPVLVIGSPGAGKSTLLARVLFERAHRALNDTTAPIPVLIELKLYGESGIWGLIQAALEDYVEEQEIEQLIADKRLLLLADGVNELPEEKARRKLKAFCRKQIPMILTTRDSGEDLDIEQKLKIQPLRSDEVKAFLRDRLSNQDQKRVQELGDRVSDFGQTPLMVWMLYSVFQGTGEIPTTRGEAYRAFTTLYAERAKEGIDLDDSRPLLEKLAFAIMQLGKPTEPQLDISEVKAQKLLGSRELKQLREHHLLQRFSYEGREGNYGIRFCHQSLQEYYAAEALLQKLPDISDYTLQRDYLNYLKWTEAIALMLSINKEEKYAETVVRLALEVDLNLGAMLAGKAKPELQKMTVDLLVKHRVLQRHRLFPWITYKAKVSGSVKSKLLGSTHSNKAGPHLEEMRTKDGAIDPEAIDAIGAIGSEAAFQRLLELIKELYSDHRQPAIKAILTHSSEEEITSMFQFVIDKEPNLWIYCWKDIADRIERYRPEAAIPGLKQWLLYEKIPQYIRERAASLLGGFGTEEAIASLEGCIPVLKECLLNEERLLSMREGDASLLGMIGTEEAISSLEDCRKKIPKPRSDSPTRSQKIVPFWLPTLQTDLNDLHKSTEDTSEIVTFRSRFLTPRSDPNDDLRSLHESINKALKAVSRNTPISETRLNRPGKDPFMRLLDIVTLKANQIDLQGLHDENPLIREAIAIKLGEKSPKKAIFFWKQILDMMTGLSLLFNHDPDFDPFLGEKAEDLSFTAKLEVRLAFVLPHWRQVLWGLISWREIVSDSSVLSIESIEILYESAVKELYEIARNEAIQALIQALCKTVCTGGSGLREIAFKELKNIDEERAIETLILKGLNSSRWDVRVWTAKTLRRIAADERDIPQAVLPLLRSLDDKVPQIRTEIALSVGKIASENLLPDLVGLVTDPSGCIAFTAIKEIQKDYGFYNYDIAQSAKEEESRAPGVWAREGSGLRDMLRDEFHEWRRRMPETPRNSFNIYGPFNNAPNYGDQRTTNNVAQQNHVEAVKEIQELLDQLEQTYSTTTEANQEAAVRDVQQHKPELRARIVGAIEKGGEKALEKLFDHPAMAIMIAVYEGFKKG